MEQDTGIGQSTVITSLKKWCHKVLHWLQKVVKISEICFEIQTF